MELRVGDDSRLNDRLTKLTNFLSFLNENHRCLSRDPLGIWSRRRTLLPEERGPGNLMPRRYRSGQAMVSAAVRLHRVRTSGFMNLLLL